MSVFLAAYLVSLIVRGEDQTWPIFSDWSAAGFEVLGSLLCLLRGFTKGNGRPSRSRWGWTGYVGHR